MSGDIDPGDRQQVPPSAVPQIGEAALGEAVADLSQSRDEAGVMDQQAETLTPQQQREMQRELRDLAARGYHGHPYSDL